MQTVFLTGGTGYLGSRLTRLLLERGHRVICFVRPGSEAKVPVGAEVAVGNPFDADSLLPHIPEGGVFVQLLGVPHPSPRKKEQFYQIDLESVRASAQAAGQAQVAHFVYVSVAQEPTGIMRDYQHVRALGEQLIVAQGLPYTFLRPWYVVGPGHWWPVLFWPVFKLLEWLPATRKKAKALALLSLRQMLAALLFSIKSKENIGKVIDVPGIRQAAAGNAVGF